jgi:hypothetical protein
MASYDMEDIRRAAYSMIENHGASAADVAVKRARNLLGDDTKEGRMTWECIFQAITEIQHQHLRRA